MSLILCICQLRLSKATYIALKVYFIIVFFLHYLHLTSFCCPWHFPNRPASRLWVAPHRLRIACDPDHMDMDLVDPHPPTSLTCGSWSVAVRMTQHGLGFRGGNINTAFSFRLFSLFFTPFPSNSSKPPTFSCWLTSPCLPEKASACQELGGSWGSVMDWKKQLCCCADGPLSVSPPVTLSEGLLPFSSARQPQTPPAAPRCNPSCISAPRALISAGKTMLLLCSFWTKSALSVPQHLRLVAVGYCGGYL